MIKRIAIVLALAGSISAARADTRAGGADAEAQVRVAGFAALGKGDLAGAEARFQAALLRTPGDGEALGGMGVIRLRQRRFAEATGLLTRAARVGRPGQWSEALAAARYYTRLDLARADLAADRVAEARRTGEALIASGYPSDGEARELLGHIAVDQARYRDATLLFTAAARLSPPADQPRLTAAAARAAAALATLSGDLVAAGAALRGGLAVAPEDVWLLHDYAHLLIATGQPDRALQAIRPLLTMSDPQALYAAALIAGELHRPEQAQALLLRVSPANRTKQIQSLAVDIALDVEVANAQSLAKMRGPAAAMREYRHLAGLPMIGIARTIVIANAMLGLGEADLAAALATRTLAAHPVDRGQREALADILARGGRRARAKGDDALALARLRSARASWPDGAAYQPARARLDREIDDVWRDHADRAEGAIAYRHRSGDNGLGRLDEVIARVAASTAAGGGRVELRGQRVWLDGGIPQGAALARFGLNPSRGALVVPQAAIRQRASGAEIAIGYISTTLGAEAGLTTVGIGSPRFIGRIAVTAHPATGVALGAWAERKPLTDSIVAYAGTHDPVSGAAWGRITRDVIGVSLSGDRDGSGLYLQPRYQRYDGIKARTNSAVQLDVGGYLKVRQRGGGTLTAGLNLDIQHFRHNENGYTFSTGGYFSPQRFVAISAPIRYRLIGHDTELALSATPGFQRYREAATAIYPGDRAAQDRLDAQSLLDGRIATVKGQNISSGFAFASQFSAFRYVARGVRIGGEAAYDSFGSYRQWRVSAGVRASFGGM